MPRAAPSAGQPRPLSRLLRAGWPYLACCPPPHKDPNPNPNPNPNAGCLCRSKKPEQKKPRKDSVFVGAGAGLDNASCLEELSATTLPAWPRYHVARLTLT